MKFPKLQFFRKSLPEPPALPAPAPTKRMVWGIPQALKPVRGIDSGAQAKIVFRSMQNAELVLISDNQDSAFQLEDRGDYWIVDDEVRREVLIK